MWSGTLRFALLSVPVKLYTATRSAEPAFHQVERGTGARIRYRRVSEATGDEVPLDDIVKGYDLGARRYVALEPAELTAITSRVGVDVPGDAPTSAWAPEAGAREDRAPERGAPDAGEPLRAEQRDVQDPEAREQEEEHEEHEEHEEDDEPESAPLPDPVIPGRTPEKRTIEVLQFVPLAAIDDIYLDRRYHLVAEPAGARALALLAATLAAADRAALVRLVLRTKEHLAVIAAVRSGEESTDPHLRLSTLRFADEVLEAPAPPIAQEPRFSEAERESASRLVEMLTGEFRPSEYTNARRERVLALVEQRARDSFAPSPAPEPVPIADLLAVLQESIAAAARREPG
jgi:non-homologous end joining protein Ku